MNLNRSSISCVSQPKVWPLVIRRDETSSAHHVFTLTDTIRSQIDGSTDGIAGAFGTTYQSSSSTQ